MDQNQVFSVGGTQIAVGLSAIIKIAPDYYQSATSLKILSGGGTLEIVQIPFGLTLSGSSSLGWGSGYKVGATEVVNIGGGAFIYLAATGATMVANVLKSYTAGATFI